MRSASSSTSSSTASTASSAATRWFSSSLGTPANPISSASSACLAMSYWSITARSSSTAKRWRSPTSLRETATRPATRNQSRAGLLLRAGGPSQLLQRQPQLGHGQARLHLREGRLRLLAFGPYRPSPLTFIRCGVSGRDRSARLELPEAGQPGLPHPAASE